MSRKSRLNEIANIEGNAIGHRVVYQDEPGIREANLYETQAIEISEEHTWNEDDIDRFREKARRRAVKEINKRKYKWGERTYEELEAEAFRLIEEFIDAKMR